jgi:hypothetical protein
MCSIHIGGIAIISKWYLLIIAIFGTHNRMKSILIGKKAKPTYLVEIDTKKKQLTIYKPDQYSKGEEFYERYVLGENIVTTKYDKLLFKEAPIAYRDVMYAPKLLYAPDMIVVFKKKQLHVSTRLQMV